jgi:hypothetical protein
MKRRLRQVVLGLALAAVLALSAIITLGAASAGPDVTPGPPGIPIPTPKGCNLEQSPGLPPPCVTGG